MRLGLVFGSEKGEGPWEEGGAGGRRIRSNRVYVKVLILAIMGVRSRHEREAGMAPNSDITGPKHDFQRNVDQTIPNSATMPSSRPLSARYLRAVVRLQSSCPPSSPPVFRSSLPLYPLAADLRWQHWSSSMS